MSIGGNNNGTKKLLVRGLESKKDRHEALETIMRSFSNPGKMESHLDDSLWQGSVFNPEDTRVTVADGRVASVVVMGRRNVRFGSVRIPAVTIGPVGTHDGFQKRGLGAAAMNDAAKYMEENGILIAYLQGIRSFYAKFGYYPFQGNPRVRLVRSNMVREMLPGKLKTMTRKDISRVAKLYEEATKHQIMTAERDKELWHWLLGPGTKSWLFEGPKLILDKNNRLCGYLLIKPKYGVEIHELVVKQDEAAMRAAIGALVKVSKQRERKEMEIPIGYNDPFAHFIRQELGGDFIVSTKAIAGSMMKIVDFPALMKRLEPLFNQRWKECCLARPATRFTVTSEIGSVAINISKGKIKIEENSRGPRVKVPQKFLSGLITGNYSINDIAWRKGVVVPEKIMPELKVLFPKEFPFTYRADNY